MVSFGPKLFKYVKNTHTNGVNGDVAANTTSATDIHKCRD
jgi:hypothetical protein